MVERGAQEEDILLARIIIVRQRMHQPRPRRSWIRPWLARWLDYGHFYRVVAELQNEDEAAFRNFVHLDPAMFH